MIGDPWVVTLKDPCTMAVPERLIPVLLVAVLDKLLFTEMMRPAFRVIPPPMLKA